MSKNISLRASKGSNLFTITLEVQAIDEYKLRCKFECESNLVDENGNLYSLETLNFYFIEGTRNVRANTPFNRGFLITVYEVSGTLNYKDSDGLTYASAIAMANCLSVDDSVVRAFDPDGTGWNVSLI